MWRILVRRMRALHTTKNLVSTILAFWGFFTNVERAVTVSTMYIYLQTFWGDVVADELYGITATSYSISVVIFTPIFGVLAHKGFRVKFLLLLSIALEIIGNLLYMSAWSPAAVIIGRFICGMGSACDPPLYADLTRVTTKEERIKFIIFILMAKQIGILIGPSCTLVLKHLNFVYHTFVINVYNGPGMLMACLWLVCFILAASLYPILDKSGRCINFTGLPWKSALAGWFFQSRHFQDLAHDREFLAETVSQPVNGLCLSLTSDLQPNMWFQRSRFWRLGVRVCNLSVWRPFIKLNVLITCLSSFGAYFSLICVETLVAPLFNNLFNWNEIKISYLFLASSGLVLVVCFSMRCLPARLEERYILLFGLIVTFTTYLYMSILLSITTLFSNRNVLLGLIMLAVTTHVIGLPFVFAYSESLYSKLTDLNDMDRAQSLYRSVGNFAYLLGPLIGGQLIHYPIVVAIILCLIILLPLLMTVFRFSFLSQLHFHPSQTQEIEHRADTPNTRLSTSSEEFGMTTFSQNHTDQYDNNQIDFESIPPLTFKKSNGYLAFENEDTV